MPSDGKLAQLLALEFGAETAALLLDRPTDLGAVRAQLAQYQFRNRIVRCLLHAWRADADANPDRAEATDPVPRHILQFWHERTPPPEVADLVAGWRERNPDHQHTLFCDETARDYIRTQGDDDALQAFDYARHPVLRSDLFRFLYLRQEGGIFIDADEECVLPIGERFHDGRPLHLTARAWLFQERKEVPVRRAVAAKLDASVCAFYVNSAPIAAAPAHDLMQAMAARAVAGVLQARSRGTPARVIDITAPTIFTETLVQTLFGTERAPPAPSGLDILDEWLGLCAAERSLPYKRTAANWRHDGEAAAPDPASVPARQPILVASPTAAAPHVRPAAAIAGPDQLETAYRGFLERFLQMNAIASVVEIGCGDGALARHLDPGRVRYLGLDAAEAIVARNRASFGQGAIRFDLLPADPAALPQGELLLVSDAGALLDGRNVADWQRAVLTRFPMIVLTSRQRRADPHGALELREPPFGFRGAYVFDRWGEHEHLRTLLVCT